MVQRLAVDVPGERVADFCRNWKVAELALFGSVLRNDFGPRSDIDVLVDLFPGHGLDLFDWIEMIEELSTIFGRKVDLVSKRGLRNPFRRHRILSTCEVIYVV